MGADDGWPKLAFPAAPPTDLPASPLTSYRPAASQGELPTLVELSPGRVRPELDEDEAEAAPESLNPDLDLESPIAAGGFGSVWLGRQTGLERSVAVKFLRRDRLAGVSYGQRRQLEELFRQEALIAARLEHPHIVPVYQLGRSTDGRLLLAMKRVQGKAWNELILEDFDLPMEGFLARHLSILIAISQAVAYAHSEGVLHRDIKPHQVIVGEFGEVMLTDWGLALPIQPLAAEAEPAEGGARGPAEASTSAAPAGTPAFMAPEQTVAGSQELGPWTDLYLLGGTLYYLLLGRPPHGGSSGSEAFTAAAKGEIVEPPEPRRPGLPSELEELALGVLAPAVAKRRPATVAGFIEALQGYLSGVSRQRRSEEIIQRAALADLPGDAAGYEALNLWVAELQRAESLWPANPRLAEQKGRILHLYATTALARRDLTLARVQAEQLPVGEAKEVLLAKVEEVAARQRTVAVQRRWALRGLLVLVLLLAGGSAKYVVDQRRANRHLVQQRDAALSARAETEGLMSFLLDDIGQRLVDLERTEVLAPVVERARQYYSQREGEVLGPQERLNRAKMLETLGTLLTLQGAQAEGGTIYRDAEAILKDLVQETEDPAVQHQLLALRTTMGLNLSDQGRKAEALALLEEVRGEIRQALAERSEDQELLILLVNALDNWGIATYDEGDLPAAEQAFAEAQALLTQASQGWASEAGPEAGPEVGPEEGYRELQQAVAMHRAVVLNESGRPAEALEVFDRHLPFATGPRLEEELASLPPAWTFFACVRGEILNNLGRHREALTLLATILPLTSRSLATDPENHEALYRRTLALEVAAAAHSGLGEEAEARRQWTEIVDVLRPVGESTDLLYLQDLLARALLRLGRREEARPVVEGLSAKGWRHRGFEAFVAAHAFEPAPAL
jgi:serine/threonine protein kinase